MRERLYLWLRSVLYALRGGFLIRPFLIALVFGAAGAILSFIMNWATSLSTGVVSLSVFWGINGYFQSMGWAPGSRLLSNWWGRHERGKFPCRPGNRSGRKSLRRRIWGGQ